MGYLQTQEASNPRGPITLGSYDVAGNELELE